MADQNNDKPEKTVIVAKNAAELQKIRLEKLMSNPTKPVHIPDRPKEYKPRDPLEFIRNIWGSSAGAGSGDFHVYRGVRRREYARQKYRKEKEQKEEADELYHQKVEENQKSADERTAKKRAKRLKKKQKQKNKKQKKEVKEPSEDEDEEEENGEDRNNSDSDEQCEDKNGENVKQTESNQTVENDVKSFGGQVCVKTEAFVDSDQEPCVDSNSHESVDKLHNLGSESVTVKQES